ncbi:MAG: GNAT family N-acetyltransferase [Bacteroidetes bacterium]|nr:GNAT family N-acetyltransferase [Bacteroidota bacterium]MBP7400614.1 GNAT family N-acetyltransferase [Chitinophagales bacterium]MBP9119451.1 GNAT family N-acetyltransferase [Ignavibacterium sp.]MBK7109611.1 GNAT family N-acetyltransferase [Bacteroidota bacterium]MBK8487656.1 GNAT family N-acetyltransferase [Bacteroidota bacterium]
MNYILIDTTTGENTNYNNISIAKFLEDHLDQFRDKKEDILKAIEYALNPNRGGFVLLGLEDKILVGAVVINHTGMEGYIPSNILVYIAVHRDFRGKGIGRKLMQEVIPKTNGGIALHVEPNNPAKFLYEKLGFTNKYLEMRYQGQINEYENGLR